MGKFVAWLLERRYRLILLAVALCPVVPLVSIALLSLETQARGLQQGLISAGISILGVVLVAFAANATIGPMVAVGAATFLLGVGLGALMGWSGSLTLAFQGSLLICVLTVLFAFAAVSDATAFWAPVTDAMAEALAMSGASEQQLALLEGLKPVLFGLLATAALAVLVGAACLGRWWYTLGADASGFAIEFRRLRLGKVLAVPATLLVIAGLVTDFLVLENLIPLILLAFLFQGLAVAHVWSHGRGWHPAILVGIYVLWLLPTPLAAAVSVLLSSVGLVDSWIDLRTAAGRSA